LAIRPLGFTLAAALGLLLAALPAALPAAPYLLKDLNTSQPLEAVGFKLGARGMGPEVSYFAGSDPAHGIELWRSDGTPGGTERLTDVCAGRCSAQPASITIHAGRIFFAADDGFSGTELWVSDGTPGSERRVRDVCPGPCSAVPSLVEEVGERMLFISHLPAAPARFELWRTDGTRDGTVPVKVLCGAGCTVASDLIPIGERALLLVTTGPENAEKADLWVTDGTAAGTRSLRALGSEMTLETSNPVVLPGDGFAWVWASDGLWRTDGTAAGTFRLKRTADLLIDPDSGHFLYREAFWHGLFFGILSEGEMIRSDGTAAGTFRIAKFSPSVSRLTVQAFALLDSEILLQVDDSSGNSVLWSSRGTEDSTGPRLELGTAETGEVSELARLSGDRAMFMRSGYPFKTELWATDGTAAGTRQLAAPGGYAFFSTGDGRAFFLSELDLSIGGGTLREFDLWITDGTDTGSHLVRSSRDAPGSSDPQEQTALGGKLVFSAAPVASWSRPLFVSDGTAAGTGLLNEDAVSAQSFFRFGDRLLFSAYRTDGRGPALWATDGTPAGTALVTRRAGFFHPALYGGQILFGGETRDSGEELWKTNGLSRTVELVKDIDPFFVDYDHIEFHLCLPESSLPVPAGVVGGRLLLAADDGRSGRELWASDGTPAGTVLLRDINPGRTPGTPAPCYDGLVGPSRHDTGLSSDPQGFVLLGSVLLFTADDGRHGRELWVTNGTFHGTRLVADLVPGPRGSALHDLVLFHGRVYFLAANPGPGESLWATDGTARGTLRVRDLALNGLPSWGRGLTVAADRLFFTVYNETTGAELWASTGNSTGLVIDLHPGPGNASPQSLTALGSLLLFAADDGLTGLEPWRTDGTAAGTLRLGDIAPGRDASSPGPFTALDNVVITGADDGVHGREPWAIPMPEIVEIVEPPG